MTLDVSIGKIIRTPKRKIAKDVEECPAENFDICNPVLTIYPRRSYRSGSFGFWEFWTKPIKLNEIYMKMRKHPNTNDIDIAPLKPFAETIAKLKPKDVFLTQINKDRLKWLQYWTKKAIELFGDDAGIMFS